VFGDALVVTMVICKWISDQEPQRLLSATCGPSTPSPSISI